MTHPKSDDIKEELQRETRRIVQPRDWDLLVQTGRVRDAFDARKEGEKDWLSPLVRDFLALLKRDESPRTARRNPGSEFKTDARVMSWLAITATDARRTRRVTEFRERVLDGKLIRSDRVASWIKRAKKSQKEITRLETCVVDRDGRRVTGPGIMLKSQIEYLEFWANWPPHPPKDVIEKVPINRTGVLGEVRLVVDRLEEKYGWAQANSVQFLLSDETPTDGQTSFIVQWGGFPRLSRIILDVESGISNSRMLELLAYARKRLPPKGRAIQHGTGDLAAFIAEANDGETTWDQARAEYGRRFPDRVYNDRQRFCRDARQAFHKVMGADLEWRNPRITDSREERMRKAAEEIELFKKRLKRSRKKK